MRKKLPEEICCRPKAPLAGIPIMKCLQRGDWRIDNFAPTKLMTKYIEKDIMPNIVGEKNYNKVWGTSRALSFDFWLRGLATK